MHGMYEVVCVSIESFFFAPFLRIHLIARMRDNGVKRKDKLFYSLKCVMRFLCGMGQVCVVLAEDH